MDYVYHVLVMASLYAILATSFNIVIGLAGLFSLSHAAFYAIGAYTTAILATRYGLPFPIPALIGVGLASLVGVLAALPALRVGGHYLVIVTLALQVIVIDTLRNAQDLTGGPDGLSGVAPVTLFGWRLSSPGSFLILAASVAVVCYLISRRIERSPFGRALRAMRENELAAVAVGKNVVGMKIKAFAVSASLAAIAGSLLARYIGFVGPQSFTIEETIYILAMVILGGTGNLTGSVLGTVVLVTLPELLKFLSLPPGTADLLRNVIYGLILIVILRVRPNGLLPETQNLPKRLTSAGGPAEPRIPEPSASDHAGATLAATGLTKSFGGIRAAAGIDIALEPGRVTGLIGPNGAGKTTAFNLLTGFLKPNGGRITFRGQDITGIRPYQIVLLGVARSFQDLRLFRKMTVLENVLVALPRQRGDSLLSVFLHPRKVAVEEKRNVKAAREILAFVGLGEKALDEAENLSYAEEKLLVIARLLATGADVLLLDEPLSGLDPTTLGEIFPVIRRLADAGRTVCIIEHNLEVIRSVCDIAYYLDEGRVLASGPPEELMRDPHLMARYLR